MIKKVVVVVFAVVSAALFALPAMAPAQEIHLEPAEGFTISGSGGEWRTSGEPTLTCTGTSGSGRFDTGSTTTGTATLDFSGCHMAVFGITASCKSEGAATAGTLASGGSFHLITLSSTVPGVLFTMTTTNLVCAGMSTITTSGSILGTVTSPKCGESSNTLSLAFTATESTQNHLSYTGANFDLVSQTGSGTNRTIAWIGTTTITQVNAAKLNCT